VENSGRNGHLEFAGKKSGQFQYYVFNAEKKYFTTVKARLKYIADYRSVKCVEEIMVKPIRNLTGG